MATNYSIRKILTTDESFERVFEATEEAFGNLGGSISSNIKNGTIIINDGKSGIVGDFLFECSAKIMIKKKDDERYLIKCNIEKRPSSIFWLLIIGGLCFLYWLWAGNVYYLFIDLGKEYQKKLDSIEAHL